MKKPQRRRTPDEQAQYLRDTRWMLHFTLLLVVLMVLFIIWISGATAQVRIDTFDKRSNRTGYAIVDPRTGRIDSFDTRSNRTGYGYITPPPQAPSYLRPGPPPVPSYPPPPPPPPGLRR
jgi:hypothetical protein